MNFVDLSGQKIGRLTVLKRVENKSGRVRWLCKCDCGNVTQATANQLITGKKVSCGCFKKEKLKYEKKTHGLSSSKTYYSWCNMIRRCNQKNHRAFIHYGGRGISVCERWMTFENFLSDMGEKPDGLTLERKNVNGNYEPSNCRWATPSQQAANTRRTIVWNGQKTTIKAVAAKHGVPRTSLNKLLKRGMRPEQALAHALERRK